MVGEVLIKTLNELTKFGIVIFVLICATAGYALGYRLEQHFSPFHLLQLLLGIGLLSSGSFALNQIQEVSIDLKMPRTRNRPLPSGRMSLVQAGFIAGLFLGSGLVLLFLLKPLVGFLGLATVLLYNVCYTMYWKPKWVFGAVPGAIPGAMPVVIGYATTNSDILSRECIYAFLIMFLWQMPHYWSLAIKFQEDYRKGGVPTLPVSIGSHATLYHIGLYVFGYVGLALLSPWFVPSKYIYLLFVVPFCFKVFQEFYKYQKNDGAKNWLPFFMWTNLSMLVFLIAPVVDKWIEVASNIR